MEYRKSYGQGFSEKPPDHTRCAASVHHNFVSHQCRKKAKYDPDEDGNPTTCAIHRDKTRMVMEQIGKEDKHGWTFTGVDTSVEYDHRKILQKSDAPNLPGGMVFRISAPLIGGGEHKLEVWRGGELLMSRNLTYESDCRAFAKEWDFEEFARAEARCRTRELEHLEQEVVKARNQARFWNHEVWKLDIQDG